MPMGEELTPEQQTIATLSARDAVQQQRIADLEKALGVKRQSAAEKLANIENLSFSELKASKDELEKAVVDAITDEPSALSEFARRYVQARTDAKMRDQRMGEQGATISDHEKNVAALEAEKAGLAGQVESLNQLLDTKTQELTAEQAAHEATKASATEAAKLASQEKAAALKVERDAKTAALAQAAESLEAEKAKTRQAQTALDTVSAEKLVALAAVKALEDEKAKG